MATPTIANVTPAEGHTGGRTLVEITGTGFRLPTSPAPTGPTSAPPPSVRVTFGTVAASNVAIFSSTLLSCLTPENDERTIELAWSVTATTDTFAAALHGLADGTPIRLVADGGPLPSPLDASRAYFVRDATAGTFKLSESVGGAVVDVAIDGAGRARAVGAYAITVENLDDAGAPITGESVTRANAFTFRRPDLGQESELARVVRALLRMLKRQILENVHFATHTDYDAETGDLNAIAFVQRLPALVVANLEVPDDRDYFVEGDQDFDAGAGRFVSRRPPVVSMIRFDLIGVSDDPIENLNLLQAVRIFFRKNPRISLDRDGSDPARGIVAYDLEAVLGGPVTVTRGADAVNVQSFSGEVRIRGVLLEDMPGITAAKPAGIPAHLPHEATKGFGHVTADGPEAVDLDVQGKGD